MKPAAAACMLWIVLSPANSSVAAAADLGPQGSWDEMQRFEHYIGNLAGALNVCQMFGLYGKMSGLAALTPYGKQGLREWGSYDGIMGGVCGRAAKEAKELLEQEDDIEAYLKAKYDCSAGRCAER